MFLNVVVSEFNVKYLRNRQKHLAPVDNPLYRRVLYAFVLNVI